MINFGTCMVHQYLKFQKIMMKQNRKEKLISNIIHGETKILEIS